MKLLTLEIKNIASLVDASIDFASPALTADPIFLVTGDTGSGKTSILNCICIALYNQVPALDEGEGKDNHQVKINSPLQLVRRHCKEAYICLTFKDKDNALYTIDWRATRLTRGANKGNFKTIERTLAIRRKDGEQEHYSRLADVSVQVEKALGLTFEQFCRTTMLAQGQFLKFINSDRKNKSEILEKITGTEIYSQVGRQIYAITKERKDRYNALDNQIKGAQLLSEDEKQQLAESVEMLTKTIADREKKLAEIDAQEKWLEAVAQANADMVKAKGELVNATLPEQTDAIGALKMAVADWDSTSEIRGIIAERLAANRAFADKNDEVIALRPTFVAMSQGLAHIVNSIEDCQRRISENQSALDKEKQYEALYAANGEIQMLIGVIEDEAAKIEQSEQRIAKAQKDLLRANADLENEEQTAKAAKAALDEQQREVDRLSDEGRGVDASALNAEKDAAAARLDVCRKAISAHQALMESIEVRTEKEEEIIKLKQKLYLDTNLLDKAMQDKEKFKVESNDAASRLSGQMDLSDRLAELTHIFKDTHACPLCGTEVQHLHAKDFIDQAVAEAKAVAEKAKKAYEAAVDVANELAANVKSHKAGIEKAEAEIKKLQLQIDRRRKDFDEFGMPAETLQEQYDKSKLALENCAKALERAIEHFSKLKLATAERDKRLKAVEAAQRRVDEVKANVKDIEAEINQVRASQSAASEGMQAKHARLMDLLSQTHHPELNIYDLPGIKSTLPALKARHEGLVARASELAAAFGDLQRARQDVAGELDLAAPSFGKVDACDNPCEYPDLVREAANFSAKVLRLNGQIEEIDRRRSQLADREEAYFAEHPKGDTIAAIERLGEETAETIASKRRQIGHYDVMVAGLKGKVEQLAERLDALAGERPASLPDELTLEQAKADKATEKAEIEALAQQKAKDASRLEQNAEREKALAAQCEERDRAKMDYYKWESLNRLLGTENGERFRSLAQSYIFGQLLRSANQYLTQLTDRYTLEGEVGSLVIYVIDHHDGGNKRVAKALSGGEGFMASLSLALALSTINQDLDPLDILFIDEGFGALDPTAREFTIDMLCSLRRRVCIISHMPELRECIPTQILVKRQPGTSRSTLQIKSNA